MSLTLDLPTTHLFHSLGDRISSLPAPVISPSAVYSMTGLHTLPGSLVYFLIECNLHTEIHGSQMDSYRGLPMLLVPVSAFFPNTSSIAQFVLWSATAPPTHTHTFPLNLMRLSCPWSSIFLSAGGSPFYYFPC